MGSMTQGLVRLRARACGTSTSGWLGWAPVWASSLLLLAFVTVFTAPADAGQQQSSPWGPPQLLYGQAVNHHRAIVTTTRGMLVAVWMERQADGTYRATASMHQPGASWSQPAPVASPPESGVGVIPVVWGGSQCQWRDFCAADHLLRGMTAGVQRGLSRRQRPR